MNPSWRRAAIFALAILSLVCVALVLENRGAVDPAAAFYTWDSGRGGKDSAPSAEMIFVPAGEYWTGDDSMNRSPDAPLRRVRLDSFYIDRHEVTNGEFSQFVAATGYVTTAEKEGGGWIYRGGNRDWKYVRGANWRHPLGPGSIIDSAINHPVVLVSWYDAAQYAEWAGKRLPTEAEWEVAARGGGRAAFPHQKSSGAKDTKRHHQIDDASRPDERKTKLSNESRGIGSDHVVSAGQFNPVKDGSANVWQGHWPRKNELIDGFFYTAPVASFAPNSLGLYDMIGNVWEWTADWYAADSYLTDQVVHNPTGPKNGRLRVARGGSWFCSSNYCSAYRPGFRGKSPPAHAFNNVGFRCVRDAD